MMRILFLFLAAMTAFADDDPWAKVRELKSGTEVRIYKTGVKRPLAAKVDEVKQDAMVVVVKNAQVAVPKNAIERVDRHISEPPSRVNMETRRNIGTPDTRRIPSGTDSSLPPKSTATGVKIKPGRNYETIYQREKP